MERTPSKEYDQQDQNQLNDSPQQEKTLQAAKLDRKKAEENVQLLSNRIALLEAEERKAQKKIEETKKRALEILDQKNRNREQAQLKDQLKQSQVEEQQRKVEQNKNVKEEIKQNAENNKAQLIQKIKNDVDMMKKIKEETKKTAKLIDEEEKLKNTQIVQSTKNREKELELKKQKMLDEKYAQARQDYEQRIQEELKLTEEKQELIKQLEQREIELIKRLENTSNAQKQAFENLELVLKDEHPGLKNGSSSDSFEKKVKSPNTSKKLY